MTKRDTQLPMRLLIGAGLTIAILPGTAGLTCIGGGAAPPPAVPPGDYDRTLTHDDLTRTYKLHVPPQHDGVRLLPLVIMFHGGFGTAENASLHYGWTEKADAEGFVVAYPDGTGGEVQTWNANHCCGTARVADVDDVGFAAALVAELKQLLTIDAQRVFATGMSNGGMFVHRLGAERPDIFAAIAPVEATIGGQFRDGEPVERPPDPTGPMPIIMVHGTDDQSVLYDGGRSPSIVALGRIDLSTAESTSFWVAANNCEPTDTQQTSANGNVIRQTWAHRGNFADVELVSVVGQGHAWAGGLLPFPGAAPPSTEVSATDLIWAFFAAHPRQ